MSTRTIDDTQQERQSVEARIKLILADAVASISGRTSLEDLVSDVPLADQGVWLDSVSLLQLIVGLENEFDITVDETNLDIEVFQDLRSLSTYIMSEM